MPGWSRRRLHLSENRPSVTTRRWTCECLPPGAPNDGGSQPSPRHHRIAQHARLHFGVAQTMLDEVPDADNSLHLAIGHHQHVPHALLGHDVEDVGNTIRRSARWWRRFHDVFRREIDAVHSVLGQRPDQQAIRDDADRPAAGIDDDDRGDVSIHEEPRNVADRSGRPCRFDPVTFQVEYLADPHRTSSLGPLRVYLATPNRCGNHG